LDPALAGTEVEGWVRAWLMVAEGLHSEQVVVLAQKVVAHCHWQSLEGFGVVDL